MSSRRWRSARKTRRLPLRCWAKTRRRPLKWWARIRRKPLRWWVRTTPLTNERAGRLSMILVAGGQLDPNVGRLLRRLLARGELFADLLVGPELLPRIRFALDGPLEIDGREI